MGLDSHAITRKEYEFAKKYDVWSCLDNGLYARKCWTLSEFFRDRQDTETLEEGVYVISKQAWIDFKNGFAKKEKVLEALLTIYEEWENYDYNCEDETEYDLISAVSESMYAIMGEALGSSRFVLGIDWETRATLKWLSKVDEILKDYEKGEEYILLMSW